MASRNTAQKIERTSNAEAEVVRLRWAFHAYARATAARLQRVALDHVAQSCCAALVEDGVFAAAFVALADRSPEKGVKVLALAGHASGYAEGLRLSWAEDQRTGQGPTGRAIRSGLPSLVGDVVGEPEFEPWRARANAFGVRSAVTVPFFQGEHVLGVLSVLGKRPNCFGPLEIEVLQRIGAEIAFTIGLENERQELNAELAHVARLSAMGEMAAALAHELNQPLTAISNTIGALKIMLGQGGRKHDATRCQRVARAADQAEAQAVRAGEIVRRLREFIARGEADARIENLATLVEEALALALPDLKVAQTVVHVDLSPEGRWVLADRVQIQQVLVNLIRNASEAMRGAAGFNLLTITSTPRGDMVEVAFRDTGAGVAQDVAGRLFSAFHSTKTTGMGVGLSICRRIIEGHGGRMWFEAGLDGADFRFTLPTVVGKPAGSV